MLMPFIEGKEGCHHCAEAALQEGEGEGAEKRVEGGHRRHQERSSCHQEERILWMIQKMTR